MAHLHVRAARHALIPEARWRARDHGVHFFTANLRDAVAALEALATPPRDVPLEFAGARERLLQCLYALREDRKSTRLNSSHSQISYAVFCLKKKNSAHMPRRDSRLLPSS